jgi:glycosyltransferase involved in cell wall biosynthesis
MKILVLQDFLRSGGTERQSILLANAFSAAGHDTTLLTFRPGGVLGSTVAGTVSRDALQPFDFHSDWFAPALSSTVRRHAPDVVLCMGRMANCYAGRLHRKFPGIAVVATMRTGKELPAFFVHSLRSVRHVVANSRDARDTLVRDYSINSGKISVIHNALVFPSVSAQPGDAIARESLRVRHGVPRTGTVLLCVAMFRPEKNQRALIETLALLPAGLDWQLWLAGDGPARAECERLAKNKRLDSRVKFLGFHRDPSALYAAADIAVHASPTEALSNFLVEAQAHGLPAVVYQAQGMEECFMPNETGWAIPRGNADAFRAAIVRLAGESAESRAQRSAAAQAFARKTFDPDRQVAAYLGLFARLTRNNPLARE